MANKIKLGGIIFLPLPADELFVLKQEELLDLILNAIKVAEGHGATHISLAGNLSSKTNYCYSLIKKINSVQLQNKDMVITTGHSCTVVAVIKTIEKVLTELDLNIGDLIVGVAGFGSIGQASLNLLLNKIGRPAKIIIAEMYDEAFVFDMQEVIGEIKSEFNKMEPNLTIEIVKNDTTPVKVMDLGVQEGLLRAIYAAHNGVYRMSADMEDLVETSNNIARVIVKDGQISIQNLTRSSVESSKMDLANALRSAYELFGCEVDFAGSYPGWTPNPKSEILDVLTSIYEKQNGEKPKVVACHAGLECGILGTNYPNMDMISFGPTIHGAHSPDERASIKSSQKFWKFVLEILEHIPVKN